MALIPKMLVMSVVAALAMGGCGRKTKDDEEVGLRQHLLPKLAVIELPFGTVKSRFPIKEIVSQNHKRIIEFEFVGQVKDSNTVGREGRFFIEAGSNPNGLSVESLEKILALEKDDFIRFAKAPDVITDYHQSDFRSSRSGTTSGGVPYLSAAFTMKKSLSSWVNNEQQNVDLNVANWYFRKGNHHRIIFRVMSEYPMESLWPEINAAVQETVQSVEIRN